MKRGVGRNSLYDPYLLEELSLNQNVHYWYGFYLLFISCWTANSVFQYTLCQNLLPSVLCLRARATHPHLMRILRTLERLRDTLIQSAYLVISMPRASAISFNDLASDSLSGRIASTASWFIIAARSDPPGYRIAGSWIKIDGIGGL